MRRNRVAMVSAWLLILFYGAAVFAGFLSPYHYDDERRDLSYHPPTKIHWVDVEGRWRRPFVYATASRFDAYQRRHFTEDTSVRYPIRFFIQHSPYQFLGFVAATGDVHAAFLIEHHTVWATSGFPVE